MNPFDWKIVPGTLTYLCSYGELTLYVNTGYPFPFTWGAGFSGGRWISDEHQTRGTNLQDAQRRAQAAAMVLQQLSETSE